MKKRLLEMILQDMKEVLNPDPRLEQYPTPADIGADLLFRAYTYGDIGERTVCEPGCGKGMLALGAALLGAEKVWGFDTDRMAVDVANMNLDTLIDKEYEIEGEFFTEKLPGFDTDEHWDTIIMNPPFGAQRPGADRPFLEFAVKHSDVVYSLHLAKTEKFVVKFLNELGMKAEILGRYIFPIKHMFDFHTKEEQEFEVALIRGEKSG
jgi:putative methylase